MRVREIQIVDLAGDLAASLTRRLSDAIAARGAALIAVSGGRSPLPLFEALRAAALDWSKVTITLVDERWVDADHPDSNEKLVRDHLLQGPAAAARFVGMKNDAVSPYVGQTACGAALQALARPFDAIVLGMGEDGHTASLFPGAAELHAALTTDALCVAVTPPAAPHARISLTLRALLQSRVLVLPLSGEKKRAVYRDAMGGDDVEAMPIRAVLKQDKVPVEVWLS